jgi:hypothetical protein
MEKSVAAASPDAYLAALAGWRQRLVGNLRRSALAAGNLEERIKWGNLVYFSNGPVLLIRAEEARVLLGFWRGKRLREFDARLKPGGKYELANIAFFENDEARPPLIESLVKAAIDLNRRLGDPTSMIKARQYTIQAAQRTGGDNGKGHRNRRSVSEVQGR